MTTLIAVVSALGVCVLGYWFVARPWFLGWGSLPVDLAWQMRGDETVDDPTYTATLAVTIHAAPEDIWPWLVQMGYQRGGLYSYDWLDRLFGYLDAPSADTILPEHQHLRVGDEIPIGRGGGFPVWAIEPRRVLVLSGRGEGFAWVWQFGLYPVDKRWTRLVSRNSVRTPRTWSAWMMMRVIEPAAFIMTRRMLIGLKRRAEKLADVKVHDDRDENVHGHARTAPRDESPLAHGLDGLFVEPHVERSDDAETRRDAIVAHHDFEHDRSGDTAVERVGGV